MSRDLKCTLLVAAVLVAAAAGARAAAPAGTSVPADAVAYHGAAQAYGRLARWAGRRAMEAETRYWKAIAS